MSLDRALHGGPPFKSHFVEAARMLSPASSRRCVSLLPGLFACLVLASITTSCASMPPKPVANGVRVNLVSRPSENSSAVEAGFATFPVGIVGSRKVVSALSGEHGFAQVRSLADDERAELVLMEGEILIEDPSFTTSTPEFPLAASLEADVPWRSLSAPVRVSSRCTAVDWCGRKLQLPSTALEYSVELQPEAQVDHVRSAVTRRAQEDVFKKLPEQLRADTKLVEELDERLATINSREGLIARAEYLEKRAEQLEKLADGREIAAESKREQADEIESDVRLGEALQSAADSFGTPKGIQGLSHSLNKMANTHRAEKERDRAQSLRKEASNDDRSAAIFRQSADRARQMAFATRDRIPD